MPYLTEAQLLRMNDGAYSRNGVSVPGTEVPPMRNAACWAWALDGEYISQGDPFSAASFYEGAFRFDRDHRPIALNDDYLEAIASTWPDTEQDVSMLIGYFPDALGDHDPSQQRCRMALMKIAAVSNGLCVLGEGAGHAYTVHMRSSSWYGWDHWAIGVRMPGPGGVVNHVQTVPGIALQYRCNAVWDEHMPESVIGVDGLLQAHVDALDRIP